MRLRSLLAVIGLTALCCVGGLAQSATPSPSSTPAQSATPAADGVDRTDTSIRRVDRTDTTIRQVDLEGLKKLLERDPKDPQPLLLNFWATWCDPCREEFPDLVQIDADYRAKKLNLVAISLDSVDEIATEVPKFLKAMKATMPVVLLNVNDPEPAINLIDATWGGQLPATFLFDKDGKVVFKHFGRFKTDELRAAIEKAVGSEQ
jgi:thiol-disulfide isomerase/thioredoxin